ncbi:MAG: RNA 2',3'-cyclic phosphodiesterase [Candidatus Methylomirabilales bacterium]
MRLFIAINLTEELRSKVASLQEVLRQSGADVSWVGPGNVHLTLKFLGEVSGERAADVRSTLRAALEGIPSFRMTLAGVGTFPARGAPRVVWVGTTEGSDGATALYERVEGALASSGFPPEGRAFQAHLTLGRVRGPRNRPALIARVRELAGTTLGSMMVVAVELMQSELHPKGAIYTSIETFSLGGGEG